MTTIIIHEGSYTHNFIELDDLAEALAVFQDLMWSSTSELVMYSSDDGFNNQLLARRKQCPPATKT